MNNPLDKRHPYNDGSGFYGKGDWQEIEAKWKECDYVIVCLGINDSVIGDIDGKYYYNGGATDGSDTTHTSIKGENLACQKIVECLKDSDSPLRFYVK